ncbi:MAG: domain S-box protein [Nevskia sp.]|nr:domain S-box protein [Nevskia sp.]
MVATFTIAMVLLLAVMEASLNLSAGVRAYVQGEGLWSKGQKDAVYYLVRFLRTHDLRDYQLYEQSIRMPLGDRVARMELDKPDYDPKIVAAGFIEGGNAPVDISGMVTLYRHFGHLRFFSSAIAIWADADSYVLELVRQAEDIHASVSAGDNSRERQNMQLERLDRINGDLTRLEAAFSTSFGDGARFVQTLLTGLILLSGFALLCCGLAVSLWITRGIRGGIERLRAGALRVTAGDLDSHIEVWANDELGELALVFNDMVERRRRTEALVHFNAQHDALTGLPNRTLLLDRLEMALRLARRQSTRLALLMIDLDYFKRINDSLGHQAGDSLLLAVSSQLQQCVRDVDSVARLGGDEFVVILNDVQSRDELAPILAKIAQAIATPVTIEDHELIVTPTIGGCIFPDDGPDTTTLLKHADIAMYHAKAAGRGNAQWFTTTMLQDTQDKLALGIALRRAVELGELTIHYQPEISMKTGRVVGMEALMRWQHPERGNISPNRFIAVAEETGQILPMGEWALKTACLACVGIQCRTGQPLMLAVNVSPRQLQQSDWLRTVQAALLESGLRPEHLELEITESLLMRNPEESAIVLHKLRALGVTVVIDDFGTGYSSLSYLTRFPIDKIKIDRSFVRGLAVDSADAAVVNAIIAMAHNLNIRVIAEGVETHAQRSYLHQRGCDEAQGFLYSAAVTPERFIAFAA